MIQKPKVTVVGSFNTDLVVRTPRMPVKGETILGGPYLTGPGGKGANQAVAAARLGAQVAMVARLGKDDFGDRAEENLRREGIQTDTVLRTEKTHTGVAVILVDEAGDNMIVVAPGANEALSPADVDAAREAIAQADILLLDLEVPMESVEHAAALAQELNIQVILNPAPGQPLSAELLRRIDVLTPNETEAQIITGLPVSNLEEAHTAGSYLLAQGVGAVVITLGALGALSITPQGAQHIPGWQVQVVDTTGAGDAFNGALAVALAEECPLPQAVTFANAAAALQVTRMGTAPAMPLRTEVETLLQARPVHHALEVMQDEKLIFYSDGKWLHPLLDLEHFLAERSAACMPYDPGSLTLRDKIIGRAAALLIVRLGLRRVHAGILSELGAEVLQHYEVNFDYEHLVPRIACQTEVLLDGEFDPDKAHALILERARR
ncbi:MAG: ribokinase [Anaerolineae bacterium]|nr:ribokinase [Anaerolineae bacterium]